VMLVDDDVRDIFALPGSVERHHGIPRLSR
jgi:hypothetical protein